MQQLSKDFELNFGDFAIHHLFPIPLEKVRICYESTYNCSVDTSQIQEATQKWNRENDCRRESGKPDLEAKPLFRPLDVQYTGEHLIIRAGITTYFDNFCLQTPSESWNDKLVIGAGLSVIPVCRDNHVLLGKRSEAVASEEGKYHVAGGHAHPKKDFMTVPSELCSASLEELVEEMHISHREVNEFVYVGLVINLMTSKPEFVVKAMLKNRSQEYIRRWNAQVIGNNQDKDNREEFTHLITLNSLFEKECPNVHPPAKGPFPLKRFWYVRHHMTHACQASLVASWLCDPRSPTEEITCYLCKHAS